MTFLGTTDTIHAVTRHVVYTASTLTYGGGWTEQPRIWCNALVRSMAPDVDEARFTIHHGFEASPGVALYTPINVDGLYVKVSVFDHDGVESDTWYGRFEIDNRQIDGNDDARTGTQFATAYGLLRELENAPIRSSIVLDPFGTPRRCGLGLVANSHFGDVNRGNRSTATHTFEGATTYVFSHEAISGNEWTAQQFIEYLLAHHTPRTEAGAVPVVWQLTMPGGSFAWLDVAVDTDRRTVKAVLDELIDRRRLSGYYVTGLELADAFQVNVILVTFNDSAIGTIPANPNTASVAIDDTIDTECEVIVSSTQVAERVIVEGAPITVTATWPTALASPDGLAPRWTEAQETAFLQGAGSFDEVENERARSRDELAAVWQQYVIHEDFGGALPDLDTGDAFNIAPDVDQLDAGAAVRDVFLTTAEADPPPFAWRHARFLPYLPIRDTDTGEYRRPFSVFPDYDYLGDRIQTAGGDPAWCLGHEAHYDSWNEDEGRKFAVGLRILQDAPGIVAACQIPQMLARSDWIGAAATDEARDPSLPERRALDYREMRTTLAIETNDRVRVVRETSPTTGQPMREKIVRVLDARYDAVLPGTVLDLDDEGALVTVATAGQLLRDDRTRLGRIADAAAEWYGKPRRSLVFTVRQLTPIVSLAHLITSIGTNNADIWVDANAVVTRIAYDFDQATTTTHASFPEVDFGAVL